MITIRVYGLFKKYCNGISEHIVHNCNSVPQAFSYLVNIFPKLARLAHTNSKYTMVVSVNSRLLSTKMVAKWRLFKGDILKIIPPISGAGDDLYAYILIVVGIILMIYGDYGGTVFQIGVGMLASGIVQLVFKPSLVSPPSYDFTDKTMESFSFSGGAANLISQGNPVGVGYGRLRVGSQVIATGIEAVNI